MFDDTTTGPDTAGCCPAPTADPLPAYQPPLPAPLPAPVAVPVTTWLDEAPAVSEPAPLVIEPAPMAAPSAAAPATGASVAFEPAPSGDAALVITADPSATTSLYPDADRVDAMLDSARADLGAAPSSMPAAPAGGALLPTPADPSLWGSEPLPGGLFPTGSVDGDGIDNASDNAPFTPAPRRP